MQNVENLLLQKLYSSRVYMTETVSYQISAPRPYPSPLMTSGAIQYGVPMTDLNSLSLTRVPGLPIVSPFIVVMFMSRLLAPKSVSFMFPLLSRNILAPVGIKREQVC